MPRLSSTNRGGRDPGCSSSAFGVLDNALSTRTSPRPDHHAGHESAQEEVDGHLPAPDMEGGIDQLGLAARVS